MMSPKPNNTFSIAYYKTILQAALDAGYSFVTLKEFVDLGCPEQKHFVLRHDLDKQPTSLAPIIDAERELGIKSTVFVRVCGCEYNPLGYAGYRAIKHAVDAGAEIGLHTGFIEFATITGESAEDVLVNELLTLRGFFDVNGVATHRDINYMYNSLPWLQQNWTRVKSHLNLVYEAYEPRIMSRLLYVNEGLNPHLCWRSMTPEQAITTGRSICMLTHPHWWYKDHAFEAQL